MIVNQVIQIVKNFITIVANFWNKETRVLESEF
jgi:hypothetical protein